VDESVKKSGKAAFLAFMLYKSVFILMGRISSINFSPFA